MAQRLVRRVCASCSEPTELSPAMMGILRSEVGEEAESIKFHRGAGCSHCNGTGYSGRVGIFELLEMDDELVEATQSADPREFARAARSQKGYVPLRRSAIDLAAEGITTMDQVVRATFGIEDT